MGEGYGAAKFTILCLNICLSFKSLSFIFFNLFLFYIFLISKLFLKRKIAAGAFVKRDEERLKGEYES